MMVLQATHMAELLKLCTLNTRHLLYVYDTSRKLVRELAIWNWPHPLYVSGWWGAQQESYPLEYGHYTHWGSPGLCDLF